MSMSVSVRVIDCIEDPTSKSRCVTDSEELSGYRNDK